MEITRTKKDLVVRIPLKQNVYNPYMDKSVGVMDNLVGVIAGDFEQGFYQLIDMDYKGKSAQLGGCIISTDFEDDEFRKLCKELDIEIWEYERCSECSKTLWGTHTFGDKGALCMNCGD